MNLRRKSQFVETNSSTAEQEMDKHLRGLSVDHLGDKRDSRSFARPQSLLIKILYRRGSL